MTIDVGYWDRRIRVRLNGGTIVQHDLGNQREPPIPAAAGDLAIGVCGLTVEEVRWRLYRDVYYYWPGDETAASSERAVTLGPNEYFVLGDNVPVSYDSRYEPLSRLPGGAILGRVIDWEGRER